MPIRAFVSQNIEQLKVTLCALEQALQSGSLEEIRASGIVTRTGPLKTNEVQLRYNQCRYELHLRAKCTQDPAQRCALLEQYPNPYTEKAMQVHSRSSVGVFGYPLPAPLVPPRE